MKDINKITIIGRLTRDAEIKYTQSGTAVSKLSIASNDSKKQADKWVDEVSFFDVVLWGKQAEGLTPYLTKGQQIAVDGKLKQNRWEQDGQKRSRVEIIAESVQLVGGRSQNNNSKPADPIGGGDLPGEEDNPFLI